LPKTWIRDVAGLSPCRGYPRGFYARQWREHHLGTTRNVPHICFLRSKSERDIGPQTRLRVDDVYSSLARKMQNSALHLLRGWYRFSNINCSSHSFVDCVPYTWQATQSLDVMLLEMPALSRSKLLHDLFGDTLGENYFCKYCWV
jgi:hypothetical protein